MKNEIDSAHIVSPELKSILEKAAKFHGHLGPFLVVGVRMGLAGLKKVGKHSNSELTVEASLPLRVPFSCVIDGLQVTTHCTTGNQKLSLKDSNSIQARFKRKAGTGVTVTLNTSAFEEMKSHFLGEALSEKEIRRLAWVVAGISEKKLFSIF